MTTPGRSVVYRGWHRARGAPSTHPAYGEAEARRRYEAGETVTALFGDESHPDVVLRADRGGAIIKVTWLDRLSRPELTYLFAAQEDRPHDQLFLEQVGRSAYDHDRPLPEGLSSSHEAWYFDPDGSSYGVRGPREGPTEETRGHLDEDQLARQWEPRPSFGEWAGVLRRER